jgi:hypothetical protein
MRSQSPGTLTKGPHLGLLPLNCPETAIWEASAPPESSPARKQVT